MVTLGLDLSLVATGYVKIENRQVLVQKIISSKPGEKTPRYELDRLLKILDQIDMTEVDLVVIEGVAMMSHNTTSLVQLSGLNYLVRKKARDNGIPFLIIPPSSLKKFIAGKGNAKKEEMMQATSERYGQKFTDDDLNDAYSLALVGETISCKLPVIDVKQKEVLTVLQKQI